MAPLVSKAKVCQKESVELACGTKEGVTSARSETTLWLSENQEWVGVCDCAVESAQSTPPLIALCVQPGLSKPPPPSKVSVRVPLATGPVGAPLFSTVLVSSTLFELSTARTT